MRQMLLSPYLFFKNYLFIGCAGSSLLHGLPIAVASLAEEQGLQDAQASVFAAPEHSLSSCATRANSGACRIFLDQGWNHVFCIGRQILDH